MKSWAKNKKGFTLVELLIVIVVIAILASISVVAYNGIQKRARNLQMTAAVKQVYQATQVYVMENGTYPVGPGLRSCVGDGYPSDPAGLCWNGRFELDTNTLLEPIIGSPPELPMEQLSNSARGMLLNAYTTFSLEFSIIGETTCPDLGIPASVPPTVAGSDLWCRVDLPPL